jgi:hypothetical protein
VEELLSAAVRLVLAQAPRQLRDDVRSPSRDELVEHPARRLQISCHLLVVHLCSTNEGTAAATPAFMKSLLLSILALVACGKHSGHPDRLDPAGAHDGSGSAMDISAPAGTAARGGSGISGAGAADMAASTGQVIDGGTDAAGDAAPIR